MRNSFQLALLGIILLVIGCSGNQSIISSLSDLNGGKTFAVPTGTVADQFVLNKFPDAKIKYFNSVLDCALAVRENKADAAVYDKPVLKNIAAKNDGMKVLDEVLIDDQFGFAVQLENKELKSVIDAVLAELKSNGTYKDMMKRWFPEKGNPASMPDIKLNGTNGVLRFGTAAISEPMSFVDANQKVVGFDIEFVSYIAQKLGKQLEIVDMEFGAMLPALIAGKVDMIGAGLSITEERAKSVLFSECYYPSGIAALVKAAPESDPNVDPSGKMSSAADIADKKIGVLLGSIHDAYATKTYPEAAIFEYQNVSDMLMALNTGKVDAAFNDHIALKEILKINQKLGLLEKDLFSVDIAAGFNEDSDKLREQFNAFLKEIKTNGVYDDIVSRWMDSGDTNMPKITGSNKNGKLKVGIVGDSGMPSTIMQDGEYVGFDIELAERFAAYLGKEFIPVDMPFGSLIASISTNKIDMIAAQMMITEERDKQIDFSDPYYNSGVSVIARKTDIAQSEEGKLKELNDIADKRIGVLLGSVHDAYATKKFPDSEIMEYQNVSDMLMALSSQKVDVAILGNCTLPEIFKANPELAVFQENMYSNDLAAGFNKENDSLRKQFNTFLADLKNDGTYDDMINRWMNLQNDIMPEIKSSGENGELRVGTVYDLGMPFVILKGEQLCGFDIELGERFAAYLGKTYVPVDLPFVSLIASISVNKIDMITASMMATAERAKQIDFSDPYYAAGATVIARKADIAGFENELLAKPEKKTFIQSVSESFYNNIILENRYMLILNGLKITIIISILSAIFGTLIGGLICFMRMSENRLSKGLAGVYISLVRGTPVLVLLMIIFYVVFASVNINPVVVAIIAFGINFGAYVSEMFRTSIDSIDKGQHEAGIAGGFTPVQTFVNIIMPQAVRQVLPVYKGEFISLVKMTSIVGYIAVQDLTKASDIIRSRTFDAFFPLIMAAVIYIVIAWVLTWALGYVELSVDPKRKRNKKRMEGKV